MSWLRCQHFGKSFFSISKVELTTEQPTDHKSNIGRCLAFLPCHIELSVPTKLTGLGNRCIMGCKKRCIMGCKRRLMGCKRCLMGCKKSCIMGCKKRCLMGCKKRCLMGCKTRCLMGCKTLCLMGCKKRWAYSESIHVFVRRIFANGENRIFSVNRNFKAKSYLD